nr:hypothetical protein CFP56_10871 [Quercus suber]
MVEGDSNEDIENDMVEVESNEDNIENEIVELNEMVETKGVENKAKDPKLGMMFDSIDDVVIYYRRYAKEKGFAVAKRTSKKGNDGAVREHDNFSEYEVREDVSLGEGQWSVIFHVYFNEDNSEVNCKCMLFEFKGIDSAKVVNVHNTNSTMGFGMLEMHESFNFNDFEMQQSQSQHIGDKSCQFSPQSLGHHYQKVGTDQMKKVDNESQVQGSF